MPHKLCQSCRQTSYSAAINGIWFCPYCGTELTLNQALHNLYLLPEHSKFSKHLQQSKQNLGQLHTFLPPTVPEALKPR